MNNISFYHLSLNVCFLKKIYRLFSSYFLKIDIKNVYFLDNFRFFINILTKFTKKIKLEHNFLWIKILFLFTTPISTTWKYISRQKAISCFKSEIKIQVWRSTLTFILELFAFFIFFSCIMSYSLKLLSWMKLHCIKLKSFPDILLEFNQFYSSLENLNVR